MTSRGLGPCRTNMRAPSIADSSCSVSTMATSSRSSWRPSSNAIATAEALSSAPVLE
jgi:hypothetical protein